MLHFCFTHHWPLVSERVLRWTGLCACLSILSQYAVFPGTYTWVCLHMHKQKREYVCGYMKHVHCYAWWVISVCMNGCVIGCACSCALSMQLLCMLGSAVTWPLLKNTQGSSSAEENDHLTLSGCFVSVFYVLWQGSDPSHMTRLDTVFYKNASDNTHATTKGQHNICASIMFQITYFSQAFSMKLSKLNGLYVNS